ncbi:MAG: ADP-ribosylglycohydrolase, partial [Actinomycetota bacterium]
MTETKLMMPVSPRQLTHAQLQRAVAALLGAAIGDALGAPFEFGPAGKYLEAFPEPVLT